MKDTLRSYFSFSRSQRMGIAVLGGLLLVLIAVRASMHLWVKPAPVADEAVLRTAWERFKSGEAEAAAKKLLPININTADSETLVSLTGIGPKTAHKILEHRRAKGAISDFAQLLKIHHFPEQLRSEIVFWDSAGGKR